MGLSTEQQMLVEQRLSNEKKSALVAYLLWFFFGGFGVHRFYLGKTKSALGILALFILGWLTIIIYVGAVFLLAVGIWLIVDIFLIPGMIEEDSRKRRELIAREVSVNAGNA